MQIPLSVTLSVAFLIREWNSLLVSEVRVIEQHFAFRHWTDQAQQFMAIGIVVVRTKRARRCQSLAEECTPSCLYSFLRTRNRPYSVITARAASPFHPFGSAVESTQTEE